MQQTLRSISCLGKVTRMNIARLNMSHAPHDWVRATVKHLRTAAETRKRSIGILMDTQRVKAAA